MIGSRMVLAFEITCVLIATAAVTLASFVYWVVLDHNGASLILIGTAGLLALLMRGIRKEKID